MSVSDLIGLISGLLQFAVACYALRVSRSFGAARIGWPFFAAFSMLALAHVLQTFHPLGVEMGFGISTNVFYEVVSVLLLASIAQAELLVWKRGSYERKMQDAVATAEAKLAAGLEPLNKANAELRETVAQLRVESARENEAQEEIRASFQDQLTASQQQFEDARALVAASQDQLTACQEQLAASQQQLQEHLTTSQQQLNEQLAASQQQLQEQLAASQQQLKELFKASEQKLAAAGEIEEDLRRVLAQTQAEVAKQREAHQLARTAFQEAQNQLENAHRKKLEEVEKAHWQQLIAIRQSEEASRGSVTGLETAITEQKQKFEQSENTCRELLAILRQSGLTEIATLSQSKVAHLTRIAKAIRDHKKDLGRFIKSDPQGKQLPESLSVIVEYLSDEQFLLLKKIGSVKKKIEQLESGLGLESKTGPDAAQLDAQHASGKAGGPHPHLIDDVTSTGTETAGEGTTPSTPKATRAASPAKAKVVSRA